MAKKEENQQMTMEEYLLSQLDTPAYLKDGGVLTLPDGRQLTKQEAIATRILDMAMKGDIRAAQYIQSIQANSLLRRPKRK